MPVQVTLDAFSGLPNKTWTLSLDDEMELNAMISAVTKMQDGERTHPIPSLGYRGFQVEFEDVTAIIFHSELSYKGVDGFYYEGPDMEVELFLLHSAPKGLLKSSLIAVIEQTIHLQKE